MLCLVDDVQWLDQASVEVLGFVARRLYADRVGMVFTVREGEGHSAALAGLPELVVGGLPTEAASQLLASCANTAVDGRVSAQVVAGVGGNPLALVELAGELTVEELSGAVPLAWPLRFGGRLEELYLARVRSLPDGARTLLLVAAADPTGDPALVHKAAEAAVGPDEQVAAELERSAGRAQARGGLAAAAAFLERSLLLTADPAGHTERILAAAQASMQAGTFGKAGELLATAETGSADSLDEFQHARIDLLRGQIAFVCSMGRDAPSLLLKAARRLEPINLGLARTTYLTAWAAAAMAGHLAGADLLEVSLAARALPHPADPLSPVDLLLDGVALLVTDGPAAAAPVLRRAADVFTAEDLPRDELRWGTIATTALWDDDAGHIIVARQIEFDRAVGALSYLPSDLVILAQLEARCGDFAAAASLIAECDAAAEATGIRIAPFAGMLLAALRGDEAEFTRLMTASVAAATAEGQGLAATIADWYAAILHNGLGRYEEAFAETSKAWEHSNVYSTLVVLPELIEAAARADHRQFAAEALDALAATTQAAGTDYALGIEARARALVTEGLTAEGWYREAIDRLARTQLRTEAARAHLLYGEWLRRQRRRRDRRPRPAAYRL